MGFQCTAAIGITTRFPIYCYISCRPHSSSVFCVSSILCGTLKKKYLSNLCPPLYLALVWFSHHTTTPPSPSLLLSSFLRNRLSIPIISPLSARFSISVQKIRCFLIL